MTEAWERDGLLTIGELAQAAGLAVRTVRFYCDEGVLEFSRSGGGHRMFEAETAVEQLTLVRRLRTLGLGLGAIVDVLHGNRSIGEAVAAERARVDAEIAEMAWRRAALHAVEAAAPGERAGRLAVLTAVPDGRAAHAALVRFWRRVFTAMPSRDFDDYVDMNVPPPPVDPSAEQVVAYAELTGLVADPEVYALVGQQIWRTRSGAVRDRRGLLAGLTEVCTEVVPMVVDGVPPHPGRELDRFVELHARARGERDSPGFRERLLIGATDGDRRVRRYWSLTGDLFGTPATAGGAHHWLYEALHRWSTEATPRMDRGGVASNGARGNRREITECGFPLSRGTMEVYE